MSKSQFLERCAALRIELINTCYVDSHILPGVDLHIAPGRAVGLLGRNGMDKTTLIRSLMGYVPTASGKARWQGGDVTGFAPERMECLGIGYVPEGPGIVPNLSVRENLTRSARRGAGGRNDWSHERVLTTFPRLAERLGHGGQQLSCGEQKMLTIGRALMTNPELIVLDEATEGLAPLIVAEVWRVIAQIGGTGISTLIVDRNYRAVLSHTDASIVFEMGLAVAGGKSDELLVEPETLARYLCV